MEQESLRKVCVQIMKLSFKVSEKKNKKTGVKTRESHIPERKVKQSTRICGIQKAVKQFVPNMENCEKNSLECENA